MSGKSWMTGKAVASLQQHYKKRYIDTGNPHFWMVMDLDNIKIWYVLYHDIGEPYEGGEFLMKLEAPSDYPFKPPTFSFLTPTNRYITGGKPCVDMGHYHSKNWSPMVGMYGFAIQLFYSLKMPMSALQGGIGILSTNQQSDKLKHECSVNSIEYNQINHPNIMNLFIDERKRSIIVPIEKIYSYIIFKLNKKGNLKIKNIVEEDPEVRLQLRIQTTMVEKYKEMIEDKKDSPRCETIDLTKYQLNKKICKYYDRE